MSTAAFTTTNIPNSSVSNITSSSPFGLVSIAILGSLAVLTSIITVAGNVLVVLSFFVERSLRSSTNYSIASLAVTDVLIGAVSMNLYTQYLLADKWYLGPLFCDIWLSLDYTLCLTSQYTVFFITVDRYCSVKIPAKYRNWRTDRKVQVVVVAAWVIPASIFCTTIMGWVHFTGKRTRGIHECYAEFTASPWFNTILTICYFWVTLFVMCILYGGIYHVALNLQRKSDAKRKRTKHALAANKQGMMIGQGPSTAVTMTNNNNNNKNNITNKSRTKSGAAADGLGMAGVQGSSPLGSLKEHGRGDDRNATNLELMRNDGNSPQHQYGVPGRNDLTDIDEDESSSEFRKRRHMEMKEKKRMEKSRPKQKTDNAASPPTTRHHHRQLGLPFKKSHSKSHLPSTTTPHLTPPPPYANALSMPPIAADISPPPPAPVTLQQPNFTKPSPPKSLPHFVESPILLDIDLPTPPPINMPLPAAYIIPTAHSSLESFDSEPNVLEMVPFTLTTPESNNNTTTPTDGHIYTGGFSSPVWIRRNSTHPMTSNTTLTVDPQETLNERIYLLNVGSIVASSTDGPSGVSLFQSYAANKPCHGTDDISLKHTNLPAANNTDKDSPLFIRSPFRCLSEKWRRRQRFSQTEKVERGRSENRARKALRTISLILGAFVVCWLPYHVIILIRGLCENPDTCINAHLYNMSYWFCYLNSPINPFCYALANAQFKKTFLRLLKGDFHRN